MPFKHNFLYIITHYFYYSISYQERSSFLQPPYNFIGTSWGKHLKKLVGQVSFLFFSFLHLNHSFRRRLDYKSQVSHTKSRVDTLNPPSPPCHYPKKTQLTMFSSMLGCVKYLPGSHTDSVCIQQRCLFIWSKLANGGTSQTPVCVWSKGGNG